MNQKMRDLSASYKAKLAEVQAIPVTDENEAKLAKALDEADAIAKLYDLAEREYEVEKKAAGFASEQPPKQQNPDGKADGFGVLAKFFRRQELSDAEKALLEPDATMKAMLTGTGATNGENYLIPEDVRNDINELRRAFISLKDAGVATVIPTTSLTGAFAFEAGTPTGLVSFADGGEVPAGAEPKFVQKPWTISLKGMNIPVSNLLTLTERASFMAYLNRWFVKNAVISENTDIIAELKKDKTAKALTGWEALKHSVNVDLDPACKMGGYCLTNQSGFAFLDEQKDTTGRPILQPNPAQETARVFQGMTVTVVSDSQLKNEADGSFPIFYGATADGVWMISLLNYLFAASEHAMFLRNQQVFRVIEGYCTMGADKDAYLYGKLKAASGT